MGSTACKAKIILDGGNAARLLGGTAGLMLESLCETVQTLDDQQVKRLTDEVAYPIIKLLNEAEDLAIRTQDHGIGIAIDATKLFIKNVIQYDGPLPKLLS